MNIGGELFADPSQKTVVLGVVKEQLFADPRYSVVLGVVLTLGNHPILNFFFPPVSFGNFKILFGKTPVSFGIKKKIELGKIKLGKHPSVLAQFSFFFFFERRLVVSPS